MQLRENAKVFKYKLAKKKKNSLPCPFRGSVDYVISFPNIPFC